ncbi:hypothetical protein [Sphingomonas sp. PL20]|uniref:hypothetical protein n=1 Tax=Sphingomonas sp. PL20 TaxID=2760712 RepID=UPI001AE2C62B
MAIGQTIQPAVVSTTPVVPALTSDEKVAVLVKLIADTIAAMPANSTSQDIEARLSFVIDQAQPDAATIKAALGSVSANSKLKAAVKAALKNLTAVLSRVQNTGTAALAAQTVVTQGTALSLGGGTSNYVRP